MTAALPMPDDVPVTSTAERLRSAGDTTTLLRTHSTSASVLTVDRDKLN
jgi:hypothetical protein